MIPYKKMIASRGGLPEIRIVYDRHSWSTLPPLHLYGSQPADWSQWSGGTRNLAAAILRWHLGITPQPLDSHALARDLLVGLPSGRLELSAIDVEAWIEARGPIARVREGYSLWAVEQRRRSRHVKVLPHTALPLDGVANYPRWGLIWIENLKALVAHAGEHFVHIANIELDALEECLSANPPMSVHRAVGLLTEVGLPPTLPQEMGTDAVAAESATAVDSQLSLL